MHVYRGMRGIKALPVVDETLDETTGTDTPPDGQYGERPDALFCRIWRGQRNEWVSPCGKTSVKLIRFYVVPWPWELIIRAWPPGNLVVMEALEGRLVHDDMREWCSTCAAGPWPGRRADSLTPQGACANVGVCNWPVPMRPCVLGRQLSGRRR